MGRKRVQITPNISGNDPKTFWAALNIWQFCIIDIMHHLAIFILVRIIDISPPALNFESFGSPRPPHPPAERVLEQKSRKFRRDPTCSRDVVGSFPLTFGAIWSSLRRISAQYRAHFGEFCEANALWRDFDEAV